MRRVLGWGCVMQWAGNAANECSLSGGLNSYCTILVTDKIRNRYAQYYLQVSVLKSGVCDYGLCGLCSEKETNTKNHKLISS
jgi:hypothetical protein